VLYVFGIRVPEVAYPGQTAERINAAAEAACVTYADVMRLNDECIALAKEVEQLKAAAKQKADIVANFYEERGGCV
jgi:hypothetical protein